MKNIDKLCQAYQNHNLTLYLGAGVSIGSGIPSWEALVLAMYFKFMDQQRLGIWRPYPNYLFAIAEWQLQHLQEPLEITARKIHNRFGTKQKEFLSLLRDTLYEGFRQRDEDRLLFPSPDSLRNGNLTLRSVADLCESCSGVGIKSVVTYNYDSLLENVLDPVFYQPIWNTRQAVQERKLPIYHVHGYVPLENNEGSGPKGIVFTEDQYNRVASDPYSWSNLVQIHCMSSTVGLMIGLSLSDRNIRRLLDAIRSAPIRTTHFALLKRSQWRRPSSEELDQIHEKAQDYFDRFARSGIKHPPGTKERNWRDEIAGILQKVQNRASEQQTRVLNELGIKPIWFNDYSDIPQILNRIAH